MNRDQARQIARNARGAWWNSDDDDRDEIDAIADAIYDRLHSADELTLFEVPLKATPASDRGEQSVHQCVACGLLVCVPSPHGTRPQLGSCPACAHVRWSRQEIPVGCFAKAES